MFAIARRMIWAVRNYDFVTELSIQHPQEISLKNSQIDQLTDVNHSHSRAVRRLRGEVNSLRSENLELRGKITRAETELNEANDEIRKLNGQPRVILDTQ